MGVEIIIRCILYAAGGIILSNLTYKLSHDIPKDLHKIALSLEAIKNFLYEQSHKDNEENPYDKEE